MFKYGELWVHDCTDDIALSVVYVTEKEHGHKRVLAHLVNRHNKIIYQTKEFIILRKDFKRWSLYNAG